MVFVSGGSGDVGRLMSVGHERVNLPRTSIGLSVLRPSQANRAGDVLHAKYYRDRSGDHLGTGLKVFP